MLCCLYKSTVDDLSFELLASSLRADAGDLSTFVEALAGKLEGALPQATRVERAGSLLSRSKRVRRLSVELGENRYELSAEGGRVESRRARAVRGIVLKTEALPLEQWIDELSRDLAREAEQSEQARLALQRLLGA